MNIHKKFKENIPLKGHYKFTLTDIYTGAIEVLEYDNVITKDAWELIANNFGNSAPDNPMPLTEAALGTGTNLPDDDDHALQTEVYRNNLFSKSNTANIVEATAYFNPTEVSGTFREAGIFAGDILISHVAINVAKSTSVTVTLDFQLVIGA